MYKELWEKHKGKIAIGAIALLVGLPTVKSTTGLGVISKDDGQICVGFVADDTQEPSQ